MFLAEPQRTPYDLNFRLLGFPVRVQPLFWVAGFVLGFQGGPAGPDPIAILTWVIVLFVSIVIHELGHALLIHRFGRPAHIVLYMLGGLAIEGEDSPYSPWSSHSTSSFSRGARTPREQIIISLAGPVAGFILAAFVIVAVMATGGQVRAFLGDKYVPGIDASLGGVMADNLRLEGLVWALLQFNIFWGLVNLLPVVPLDGGRIAEQLLVVHDPWGGAMRTLWVSIFVAGATAIVALLVFEEKFVAMFFALLAISNFLTLQQMGGGGGARPW